MEHQIFVDRLLENENLTGDLEDGPAKKLLAWGTEQVPGLVQALEDEEVAGTKVVALMGLMRQVNRTAANCAGASPEDLAEELGRLLEKRAQVYEDAWQAGATEVEAAAAALAALTPDQAVTFLIEWLKVRTSH
jgi:hypothetical protein